LNNSVAFPQKGQEVYETLFSFWQAVMAHKMASAFPGLVYLANALDGLSKGIASLALLKMSGNACVARFLKSQESGIKSVLQNGQNELYKHWSIQTFCVGQVYQTGFSQSR
jgi:hypothetical protein